MIPELPFDIIDTVVCAEVPDPQTDPELYRIVQQFQIHPTTHLSRNYSRCNKQGTCVFGFPYPLQPTTTINEHGRVQYRRRKEADSWVVSYIPFLSRVLQCHLHVDICFTVNVFMYLYKYLFKGPDYTQFQITQIGGNDSENDEFKDYIHGRYLSSSEAIWRIFNFHITQQIPAVKALQVHLPNHQLNQMYRKTSLQSNASQLLRYFCRPLDSIFNNLLYCDYFSQYVLYPLNTPSTTTRDGVIRWDENYAGNVSEHQHIPPMFVQKRKGGIVICRLRTVPPKVGELFYLRILLLHKPARSFQELKTISQVSYDTFQEAAIALGLFDNSNEARYALEEGIQLFYRPAQLRFLFANLLFDIAFPAIDLWDHFCDALCADCQTSPTHPINYEQGLQHIDAVLCARGGNLQSFGLPVALQSSQSELQREQALLSLESHYNKEQALRQRSCLTNEQEHIFHSIVSATGSTGFNQSPIFFIDGPAGRGKTFLVNTIISHLRSEQAVVIIAGTTALSVTLYPRGRTAHSFFGIPVNEVS